MRGVERRVLVVATAAIAVERYQRAIDVLESYLASTDEDVHRGIYERLATAYLAMSRADEAINSAKRGLASNASDAGLNIMLINAYASKSDWSPVVSLWEKLPEAVRTGANVWTHISIARAYRKTGDYANAERIARNAAIRWPQNEFFQQEIYRCRPFLVDWPNLWTANSANTNKSPVGGAVDSLGFLMGGSLPLTGWLNPSEENETEVSLTVNGVEIASTIAAPAIGKPSGKSFSINCADMLEYVGDGDVVDVRSGPEKLVLPGFGQSAVLACHHESRMDELIEKLRKGFVFTKDGRLRSGLTNAHKKSLLDLFDAASDVIASWCGRPVYPFYGNLLGALRHNDFISHDIGGFDMLYLCDAREPGMIQSEVVALCRQLIDAGFHVTAKPYAVMIRSDSHPDKLLDLSYGWFDTADELNVSYGWRFEPAHGKDRFVESRDCRVWDRDLPVPGNAEDVLVQLYGPTWQIPDQGFSIDDGLTRVEACLLSSDHIRAIEQLCAASD